MSFVRITSATALALVLAAPALASFGSGTSNDPPPAREVANDDPHLTPDARQEAERWYHDAFEDIQKGKADLQDQKAKKAEKRFRRAIERAEKAIALDPKYHEAWNLAGYAARKLKEYDRAVTSYQRCLEIRPDYAPAREYLGEAYLEMGKVAEARKQLEAIDALKAPEEARTLQAAIQEWEKANPATDAPSGGGSN